MNTSTQPQPKPGRKPTMKLTRQSRNQKTSIQNSSVPSLEFSLRAELQTCTSARVALCSSVFSGGSILCWTQRLIDDEREAAEEVGIGNVVPQVYLKRVVAPLQAAQRHRHRDRGGSSTFFGPF